MNISIKTAIISLLLIIFSCSNDANINLAKNYVVTFDNIEKPNEIVYYLNGEKIGRCEEVFNRLINDMYTFPIESEIKIITYITMFPLDSGNPELYEIPFAYNTKELNDKFYVVAKERHLQVIVVTAFGKEKYNEAIKDYSGAFDTLPEVEKERTWNGRRPPPSSHG